jgi:hypothetical protein
VSLLAKVMKMNNIALDSAAELSSAACGGPRLRNSILVWLLTSFLAQTGWGEIYVANYTLGTVAKYANSGAVVNASLITGLTRAAGIALGTNGHLYVADSGKGTIGEYTSFGATVDASLVTGLSDPMGLVLDGNGHIYVASYNQGTVGEYTVSGTTVNAALIAGLFEPTGLTLDGQGHVFMVDPLRTVVVEYTTSGTLVNSSLCPGNLVVADGYGYLFVAQTSNGTNFVIAEYTTSGVPINTSLISGSGYAAAIVLDGNQNIFLASGNQAGLYTIGEYTTSGGTVNASLITGLSTVSFLTVTAVAPSPPSVTLMKAVKPSFSNLAFSASYQLQVSANMTNWSNYGSPFVATNSNMIYPQYWDVDNWNQLFFRLQLAP